MPTAISLRRREILQILGSFGCGMTVAPQASLAGDHGHQGNHGDKSSKLMAPVNGIHGHFCGIHIAKKNPKFQIVAQHYCSARNDEMHQCLLYDSCEANAKLLGVEYIITDGLYRDLPESEKPYWHPHTYEVLAGGLIAPGMDAEAEENLMKFILTTWGKTWHTWPDPRTEVPIGEPLLIWSLTGDGQADDQVVAHRDKLFGVSTRKIRERRVREIGFQVPQVPQPGSLDGVGRQWTSQGPDEPTPAPVR
jgi:hypothetical protein